MPLGEAPSTSDGSRGAPVAALARPIACMVSFLPMPLDSSRSACGLPLPVFACSLVLCWVGFQRADAQRPTVDASSPAQRHSLSLEAQSVANGGATQIVGNGSGVPLFPETTTLQAVGDRRVASNRTNLKISIRNLGTALDHVRVEWFFVALPVNEPAAANHEIIFHRDAQTLAIPGGKTATQVVSSPEVQAVYDRSTAITAVPLGYPYYGAYTPVLSSNATQKGLTIRGWMVRLVGEDGAVLAAKGSSQTYEDVATNPAKLAGMLARPGSAGDNPQTTRDSRTR